MLGRVLVAVSAAAALLGAATMARAQSPDGEKFLWFSGADAWRGGDFIHGGLIWSPGGLDREGFAVKSLLGAGRYRYTRDAATVTGLQSVASVLPGWRFIRGKVELALFAGIDLQHHRLIPDDPGNRLRGGHIGLRAGADLWWEPTAASMVSAAVSVSTIGTGYWSRVTTGWRMFEAVYVGPEVTALGDTVYRQVKFGAHATGLRIGDWEWSVGAGWTIATDRRSGIYGRIGVLTRR